MTTAIATFPIRATGSDVEFISHDELADMLRNTRGSCIVTIASRTEPRLLAKHPETDEPNPYRGNVTKVSRVNGIVGWQYERTVNRQRAREEMTPDFEALPRKWGFRLPGTPLVEHNGNLYVELKVQRSLGHEYETVDGESVDSTAVEEFLPRRSPSRQGVEREIILRDYALSSILSVKMGGATYMVCSAASIAASLRAAA